MLSLRHIGLALLLVSAPALALVPPPDAGPTAADSGVSDERPSAEDAGVEVADTGAYPDTGCPDGVCCIVLPDWDAAFFDTGSTDTGARRRRPRSDAGSTTPPDEGGFGCSAGGAASLLWLIPLAALRRRRND
jgi:hypothetical protein